MGCGLLAVASLSMMVANIAVRRAGHLWPICLLVAFAFAAANFVVFIATLVVDSSAVFDDVYLISVVLVGPAIMLVALILVTGFLKRLGVLGFAIWIAGVALAHLWIIAAASSSI